MIAGVEGCKAQWIAVTEDAAGRAEIQRPCRFAQLFDQANLDLVVIDIPIGLADTGSRQADLAAKAFLKHRHVCVFPVPIRAVLECPSREKACEASLALGNSRVNVFQWAILPKIRSVDSVLRGWSRAQDRIREGHPEVSFATMNGNTPLLSKKKESGIKQRLGLVEQCVGIRVKPGTPHLEDVVDACALLWTARRIRLGQERLFPEVAEFDRYGLRMEIAA